MRKGEENIDHIEREEGKRVITSLSLTCNISTDC